MTPRGLLRFGPISPAAAGPLYEQIVNAVKREIAAGRLSPGEALPSVRALATELLVSLITIKRAYEELERAGIIYSRQGLGTFVADNGAEEIRRARREQARRAMAQAVRDGRAAGLSDKDLIDWLWKEL
ncbi:MAG TPA: GntR family transcriptional regulator [Rhizomicrobium sp.]|jgi:GntR family transcriptional regulator|nr:GntR family transcriptional regulator [Rhizomicrobium sp.]